MGGVSVLWLFCLVILACCNISFNTFDIGFYNMIHLFTPSPSDFVTLRER